MHFLGVKILPSQAERLAGLAAAGTSRSATVREALRRHFAELDKEAATA